MSVEFSVSGTFTSEVVIDPLRFWAAEVGLTSVIRGTGYDQIVQTLLMRRAGGGRRYHVIFLRLEDWGRRAGEEADGGAGAAAAGEVDVDAIERNVEDFLGRLGEAAEARGETQIVAVCPPSAAVVSDGVRGRRLEQLGRRIEEALGTLPGVHWVDLASSVSALKVEEIYDEYLERLARIPYTPAFFAAAATAVMRTLVGAERRPYKVIVVDCDNTLWRGVCGEEGPLGVEVTPGRRLLQEYLIEQVSKGFLVCLCSRNNEEDVFQVFRRNPGMVLSMDKVVSYRIGWGAKASAVAELAGELDLALSSFVFLDDDPVECARMEAEHPEVLTLRVPEADGEIGGFLTRLWAFDGARGTAEDAKRTRRYQEERGRREVRRASGSLREFIAGLELRLDLREVTQAQGDIERAAQITERTTQFNTTGIRLSVADVQALIATPGRRCLIVEVSDRFGDYGKTGLVVIDASQPVWQVSFLALSCRVLGRDAEYRMLELLAAEAGASGASGIAFEFCQTERNAPAHRFLTDLLALAGLPDPVRARNVFSLDQLAAALARREAKLNAPPAEIPEPDAVTPVEPPRASSEPGPDWAAVGRRFYRSAALKFRSADDIVQAAGGTVSLPTRSLSSTDIPRTPTQRTLAKIWAEVLRVSTVGIKDDFFALGGHSLLITAVAAKVRDAFGVELPLSALAKTPTVEALAERLPQFALSDKPDRRSVLLMQSGTSRPLFLVHPIGGGVACYEPLVQLLGPDQSVYGLQASSHGAEVSIEQMAAQYTADIMSFDSEGPYQVAGWSFGGVVAYEICRQLCQAQKLVALAALIAAEPLHAWPSEVVSEQQIWRVFFRFLDHLRAGQKPSERDMANISDRDIRIGNFDDLSVALRASGTKNLFQAGTLGPGALKDLFIVFRRNFLALRRYKPDRYPGRVTLFVPAASVGQRSSLWSSFAACDVVGVPGDHMSILRPPHLEGLASALQTRLDGARSPTSRLTSAVAGSA